MKSNKARSRLKTFRVTWATRGAKKQLKDAQKKREAAEIAQQVKAEDEQWGCENGEEWWPEDESGDWWAYGSNSGFPWGPEYGS